LVAQLVVYDEGYEDVGPELWFAVGRVSLVAQELESFVKKILGCKGDSADGSWISEVERSFAWLEYLMVLVANEVFFIPLNSDQLFPHSSQPSFLSTGCPTYTLTKQPMGSFPSFAPSVDLYTTSLPFSLLQPLKGLPL
jgi:hypothetical protein